MDLVFSGSSLWGFYITACHCRIQSFSLENNSHRVSEAFLHSSSALYLQPSMREVKDRKPKRCQVSQDSFVTLLLSVPFAMRGCSSFELGYTSVTAPQRTVVQASAAVLLNFDQELAGSKE